MGWRSVETISSANFARQILTLDLSAGSLISAALTPFGPGIVAVQSYGHLTLTTLGDTPQHIITTLAAGYFSQRAPLYWHGALPCSNNNTLLAEFFMTNNITVRLSCYIQDTKTSSSGIPRDP